MNSNDKKISDQQDILKLITVAKREPKVAFKKEQISEFDDIRQFISDNNIKPHSTIKIPAHLIYNKYVSWCKINNCHQRSSAHFFARFKKLFNRKSQNNLVVYLLHPEGWDLTIAGLQFSREQYYNAKKRPNKRKKG